uniref:Plastid lipid-associated protein/fibrillin conserved domain-containing protein n=1 Tax=Ditylum brightwellii TaxID=49249 RepID=A0A7S2E5P5_9STRA|mmetsp:Transcript_14076/g.21111  ORF Transcript_14076/g.21111 Transcript_14076/m.21111 type:complete len:434 (+) Transcript_14076:82-1383(+)
MRFASLSLLLSVLGVVSANSSRSYTSSTSRSSYNLAAIPAFAATTTSSIPASQVESAKTSLVNLAVDLKESSKNGVFLTNPDDRANLMKSVSELEALCGPPSVDYDEKVVGDWTLLCTTASPTFAKSGKSGEKKKKKLPFGLPDLNQSGGDLPDFFKNARDSINKSVEVTQRIRCSDDGATIDRVDNIIEYTPFNSLDDIFGESNPLRDLALNLNPLEVTKSKVVLAHDAEVKSRTPVYRTNLALKSVILNVAGTSQNLDASGADILGLNVPLGEFLNAGSFDTTYVDDNIRISRGQVGFVEQLRVFVRKGVDPSSVMEDSVDTDETLTSGAEVVEEEEEKVEETPMASVEEAVTEDDDVENGVEQEAEEIVVESKDETEEEVVEESEGETEEVKEEVIEESEDKAEEVKEEAVEESTKEESEEKTEGESKEE